MRRVLILDTSILCVWLKVPNMDTCGSDLDTWDRQRVENKIATELNNKTTFVLPLATIIETGNHIAQARHSRKERGEALADLMRKSADEVSPWAAFSAQSDLWSTDNVKKLADAWPDLATRKLSLGDATIKDIAAYYAQLGYVVEILTGDQGLKVYESVQPVPVPRRRRER